MYIYMYVLYYYIIIFVLYIYIYIIYIIYCSIMDLGKIFPRQYPNLRCLNPTSQACGCFESPFFIIREMDDINTNPFMCRIVTQYDTQALSQALGLHIFFWFMLAYSIDHNLVMVFPSKIYMTTISSETRITTSYKNHIHLTTIFLIKSSLVTTFFGILGDAGRGVIREFTVLSGPCFCGRWLGSGPPRRGAFRGEKGGFSMGFHGDFMVISWDLTMKNIGKMVIQWNWMEFHLWNLEFNGDFTFAGISWDWTNQLAMVKMVALKMVFHRLSPWIWNGLKPSYLPALVEGNKIAGKPTFFFVKRNMGNPVQ